MKADLVLRRKGQIDLFADILIDNGNSAVDFCADEVEFYFDVQVSISFIKEAETSIRLETVRNGVWRLSPKRYIIFANPSPAEQQTQPSSQQSQPSSLQESTTAH